MVEAARKYARLEAKLAGESFGGQNVVMGLNPKQQKAAQAELKQLRDTHGDAILALKESLTKSEKLQRDISENKMSLERQWHEASSWLLEFGFLDEDYKTLTPRGRACAAFADGHPLILGTIVTDMWLEQLSAPEICAWLCMFLKDSRGQDITQADLPPPKPSASFEEVLYETESLAEILEVTLDRTLTLMMLDWTCHKDITRIAQWVDPALLGTFVKAVMRVSSYIDVLKEVLLGLGMYEVHNKLDNHMDLLLGGLVTNESLYLRIADE